MNASIRLRRLTRTDLPFADSLRAFAGWNQTLHDWERLLDLEPEGCFLAEWDGVPAGTATTTVYGRDLAWIGMVLVHPDQRRRGIGRALLVRCIDHLRGCGVRCLALDATPLGRPVYDRLGFKPEWTLARWQREPTGLGSEASVASQQSWSRDDLAAIEPLDSAAFGVSRRRLLELLERQPDGVRGMETAPNGVAGYGLLRPGAQALYVGPLVAKSSDAAGRILEGLLSGGRGRRIFWDIPDPNSEAEAMARHHGFTRQRPLIRMSLGDRLALGDPLLQFAIAGPECG